MSSTLSCTQFTTEGFSYWKNSSDRLIEQETLKNHLNSFIAFGLRSKMLGRIDTELQKQVEEEKSYWKIILTRLITYKCY